MTPSGPTGNLAAWLYSRDPSGAETRIGMGSINLRFADGTEQPKDVQGRLPVLPPSPVFLEVGGSSHSVLELPTVVRPGSAYFTPPQPPS